MYKFTLDPKSDPDPPQRKIVDPDPPKVKRILTPGRNYIELDLFEIHEVYRL